TAIIDDYYVLYLFFFFFQAEDGIRDRTVTGVQTCALPISMYFESLGMPLVKTVTKAGPAGKLFTGVEVNVVSDQPAVGSTGRKRSEERRVGKECRSGRGR